MPLQTLPALSVYLPKPYNHNHPLARGLVSWWLCVPGWMAGPRWLDLAYSNHGILTSMGNANNGWRSTTRQGGFGHMLCSGGSGGYINAAIDPLYNTSATSLTVSFWVNIQSLPVATYQVMAGNAPSPGSAGGWQIVLDNRDGTHPLKMNMDLCTGPPNHYTFFAQNAITTANTWHQVVFTYDGTTGNVYIDGLNSTTTRTGTTGSFVPLNAALNLAAMLGDTSHNLNGYLDDFRLYNRALSASEVFEIYTSSRTGYPQLLNQTKTTLSLQPWNQTVPVATPSIVEAQVQSRPYLPKPLNHDHPLARGLTSWWLAVPGWMGGPQWYDIVGTYHGTLTSMGNANNGWRSTTRQGGFGSMLFDGSAGFVTFNATPNSSTFTWTAWVNPSINNIGLTHSAIISANNPAISFELRSSGNGGVDVVIGGFTDGVTAWRNAPYVWVQNQWSHILVTFDGSVITVYQNGQSIGTKTITTPSTNGLACIGRRDSANGEYWPGYIDDVRIYNRPLSASEAFDLYENSRLGYPRLLNQTKKTILYNPASGALAGGLAPYNVVFVPPIAQAGVWANGSATNTEIFANIIGQGGAYASGLAPYNVVFVPPIAPAGVLANGSAIYEERTPILAGYLSISPRFSAQVTLGD